MGDMYSISELSDRGFFEKIYEYDEFMQVSVYKNFYLENTNKIAYANVFTITENSYEYLTAVSTYVISPNTKFKAYYSEGSDFANLQNIKLDAPNFNENKQDGEYQYTTNKAGYITFQLAEPVKITSEKFAIVFEVETSDKNSVYIPVEKQSVNTNASFIAPSCGSNWTNYNSGNFCIKAFTKSAKHTWNFDNDQFSNYWDSNSQNNDFKIKNNYSIDGLSLLATNNKFMQITSDVETINSQRYSHRLELEGLGNPNQRAIKFEVFGDTDIYITAKSSSQDTRNLIIADETGNILTKIPIDGFLKTNLFSYIGDRKNIYIYSENENIYIYELSSIKTDNNDNNLQRTWNFSDASFFDYFNFTDEIEIDGLTIIPNATLENKNATLNGTTYTKCLKFSGSGDTTQKSLKFDVKGECLIKITGRSNGNDIRPLFVVNNYGYVVDKIPLSAELNEYNINYFGNSGTIYIYSGNSAVQIFNIEVKSISTTIEPRIERQARKLDLNNMNTSESAINLGCIEDQVVSNSGLEIEDIMLSGSSLRSRYILKNTANTINEDFSSKYKEQITDTNASMLYDILINMLMPSDNLNLEFYKEIELSNVTDSIENRQNILKEIRTALSAVLADNPIIYFVDSFRYNFISDNGFITKVQICITKNSKHSTQWDIYLDNIKLSSEKNNILNTLNLQTFPFGAQYLKAEYIKEQLLNLSNYSESALNPNCSEASGVLIDRIANSKGFAKAFKLLCDDLNITCLYAEGYKNLDDHGWNYVYLDDNWYLCDITSADSFMVSMPQNWQFMNISPYGHNNNLVQLFNAPSLDLINYYILGDATTDGIITADDSAITLSYVINPSSVNFKTRNMLNADVNKDGRITADDVSRILQIVLGTNNISVYNLIDGIEVTNTKISSADINGDNVLDLNDFAYLINHNRVCANVIDFDQLKNGILNISNHESVV